MRKTQSGVVGGGGRVIMTGWWQTMVDNSDWTEEGMDARLQERTEAKKSKSRERCEKEAMIAEEERKEPKRMWDEED